MSEKKQDSVHLHNHSHFSVQDALPSPTKLAMKFREMGFRAGALTDHGRMGGSVEFVDACRKPHPEYAPITPIVGVEVYTCADRNDKRQIKVDLGDGKTKNRRPKHNHLTLLAMNEVGYRNLLRISSIGAKEGYYYDPRVDWEVISTHSEGIIALSGCLASEVNQALLRGEDDKAEQIMRRFKDLFGDRYYAELQYHGIPEQKLTQPKIVELAKKLGIPTVASNDIHYLEHKDWKIHHIAIQRNVTSEDMQESGKGQAYSSHQFYVKTADSMHKIFDALSPESVHNSIAVAERVEDYLRLDVPQMLPKANIPIADERFQAYWKKNLPYHPANQAYLAYLAADGLRELGLNQNPTYRSRLRTEIEQIWYMGVTDYFLIEYELVAFMRSREILYGIRGSAPGSLVNYCLRVSTVDPIRWNLMFERFLNPGRGTQYDINYSCLSVKEWQAQNEAQNQEIASKRLQNLILEKTKEEGFQKYGPVMQKERWVLENQGLASYLCDLADQGFTSETNEANLWTAHLLNITPEPPTGEMKVKRAAPLPDVDTDMDDSRRSESIEWTKQRFGDDHVSMIGTRGTYQSKAAVVGALKFSENFRKKHGDQTHKQATEISKTIVAHVQAGISIDEAIEQCPEFAKHAAMWPEEMEIARQLVGTISHFGVHAAGVLVSTSPISDNTPLENNKGVLASAYDMGDVERVGLVKYDFLGLATYQMIARCLASIKRRHNKIINLLEIPLEDPEVFKIYAQGKTCSVFQFASPGITKAAKQVRISNTEDIIAVAALYRPGPKAFIPDYAEGKKHPETVQFAHPLVEKHLAITYGIMVYQEQAMFLALDMAGFSWSEVDDLRKAVSKKDPEKFDKVKKLFQTKALANGIPEEGVNDVLHRMEKFAGYAFNRCTAGSTKITLAASSNHSDGTMKIKDLYDRLHGCILPAAPGNFKLNTVERYQGNCLYCETDDKPAVWRGLCSACHAWHKKFKAKGLFTLGMDQDGRLRPKRIKDVYFNGVHPVWRIILADGREITATANHRHYTPSGWVTVDKLKVGDALICMGEYKKHKSTDRLTKGVRRYAHNVPNFERKNELSVGYIDGGSIRLKAWTKLQNGECALEGCIASDANGNRMERAHLDGNRTNNEVSNLRLLCVSHHKKHDYENNSRQRRWEKGRPSVPVQITSIEALPPEPVYDVEIDDPHHSWVGNGVVTHNSHACAYAILSYWTAWFRKYYPADWLAACIHVDRDDEDKMAMFRHDCTSERILVQTPNVNDSGMETLVTDDGRIALPLTSLNGVGSMAEVIASNQPFENLKDMAVKARPNRGMVESLAKGGALSCFPELDGKEVAEVMEYYDQLVVERNREEKEALRNAKKKFKSTSPLSGNRPIVSFEADDDDADTRKKPNSPRPSRPVGKIRGIRGNVDLDSLAKDFF